MSKIKNNVEPKYNSAGTSSKSVFSKDIIPKKHTIVTVLIITAIAVFVASLKGLPSPDVIGFDTLLLLFGLSGSYELFNKINKK